MRNPIVRVVVIAFAVTLIGAVLVAPEAAQCTTARLFASANTGPFDDNVRIEPNSAENAGNEIGRFWQSSNSHLGHNFNGECDSNNGAAGWWQMGSSGRRRIEGVLSNLFPADDTNCEPVSCPVGDWTVLVEDKSVDGTDALFIAFRVDETPANSRWWDFSRVDPAPSPSFLQMLSFPAPDIVSSSILPGGGVQLEISLADVAPNVHAVNGPNDDPLPASSVVSSYDIYRYSGPGVPSRNVADWTLVEIVPYEDGPGITTVDIDCTNETQLAIGLSFEGGTGPPVVSALVGRGVPLECEQSPVNADAGEDQIVECAGPEGTSVTLDGSGTEGAFELLWTADGIVLDDPQSYTPTGLFPVGATEATLTAFADPYVDEDAVQITIQDETDPILNCGFNVAGGDDEGDDSLRLAISLMAEDLCCGEVEVAAEIDLGWVQLPVVDGQIIGLSCSSAGDDEGDDCGSVNDCAGHLGIRATEAVLRAVSADCNGNVATCAVNLCGLPSGGSQRAIEMTPRRGGGRLEFGSSNR